MEKISGDPDKLLSSTRTAAFQAAGIQPQETTSQSCCPVYGDDPSQMTSGRLLARFMARNVPWYCPNPEKRDMLDRAWAHYEHVTLARVYTDDVKDPYCRAIPGEKMRPTRLYPLLSTPNQELGDFGISARMYFSSLVLLSAFLSLAGCLCVPLSLYFASEKYDGNDDKYQYEWAVQGSALCTDMVYAECDDSCRAGNGLEGRWYDIQNSVLVLRNACNFEDWLWPGLLSYMASVLLIVLFGVAFLVLQRKAEVVFDEQVQTASDYSIKISNPPPDALNPSEWKDYLQVFGHVTACTVAIDNAELLNALVKRRRLLKKLNDYVPLECDIRDRKAVEKAVMQSEPARVKCWFRTTPEGLLAQIVATEEIITNLLNSQYRAVAVFLTFETERAQRNCLHALSTGKWNAWRNRPDTTRFTASHKLHVHEAAESSQLPECRCEFIEFTDILEEDCDTHSVQVETDDATPFPDTLMFRGKHVVSIKEACEPNDVRWKDLQVSSQVRFVKYVGSVLLLMWFVVWSAFFVYRLEHQHPGANASTLFLTITNVVVPKICDFINSLESHSTEQSRQGSHFIKVALFRCFNSAIVYMLIIGFTQTITPTPGDKSPTLSQSIYNLIAAELFTVPVIKLLDIVGFVRKHILAPRARDAESMNSYFVGGKNELAERYTDATKVLFVALFYSAILPQSLFLGAAALLIHYAVGKFCLLRIWRPASDIGHGLSRLSRNCFFSTSVLLHVVMSAFWWSGYPYDNLCQTDDGFEYCNQDFLGNLVFPPLPRFQQSTWMTSSQETIVSLYSWTALVVVVAAIVAFFTAVVVPFLRGLFRSIYTPDGKDQGINFGSVLHRYEVQGYLPQLREAGFAYPLLATNLLNGDLIGWKDPFHVYEFHSLLQDAKDICGEAAILDAAFSQSAYWPPTQTAKT